MLSIRISHQVLKVNKGVVNRIGFIMEKKNKGILKQKTKAFSRTTQAVKRPPTKTYSAKCDRCKAVKVSFAVYTGGIQ